MRRRSEEAQRAGCHGKRCEPPWCILFWCCGRGDRNWRLYCFCKEAETCSRAAGRSLCGHTWLDWDEGSEARWAVHLTRCEQTAVSDSSNDKKITFPDPKAVDPDIQKTNPGTLYFTTLRARVVAFGTHDMARAFDRWTHVYEMTSCDPRPKCTNHPESPDSNDSVRNDSVRNDSVLDCEVFTMVKTVASTTPRGRGERDAGNAVRRPEGIVEVLAPDSARAEPIQVEVTGDHPKLNKGQPVRFEQLTKNENSDRKPEYRATSILAYGPPDCKRSALRAIVTGPPAMDANIHKRDRDKKNWIKVAALGIWSGLHFWPSWRKRLDPGITDYSVRGDLTMAIERCASKELRKG